MENIRHTLVQSFKYSAASAMYRGVTQALSQAVTWTKELNNELTAIQAVAGKSASQMDKIYESTLKGAKELKIAATEYAKASYIFYQQGLNDKEVEARTSITVKAAKAARQETEEMASQLTAIWNTYKMTGAAEQERAASVGARLAAETAVDFKDIAQAMQSSASAASTMGVEYESLAAIIATVGDVTQQSASIIGNAYKTIFSRMEQLKAEGTDGEVTLNRVSAQLQQLGVNVLDATGQLKPLDEVIQYTGEHWSQWSTKQQVAIAELVGGTRQYTQFLALMNNFDKYQKNLQSAKDESGESLMQQYSDIMTSVDELSKQAGESWKRAFGQIIDDDILKNFYKAVKGIGDTVGLMLKNFGGIKNIALLLAAVFKKDIVKGLNVATVQLQSSLRNLSYSFGKSPDKWVATQNADIENRFNIKQGVYRNNPLLTDDDKTNLEQKLELSKQIAKIEIQIEAAKKGQNIATQEALEMYKQMIKEQESGALGVIDSKTKTVKKARNIFDTIGLDGSKMSEEEMRLLATDKKGANVSNEQLAKNINKRLAEKKGSITRPIAKGEVYLTTEGEVKTATYNHKKGLSVANASPLTVDSPEFERIATAAREAASAINGVEDAQKRFNKTANEATTDKLKKQFKDISKDKEQRQKELQNTVTNTISGMTSVLMASNMIANVVTQIANSGNDVGEIIENILTMLPMFIPVIVAVFQTYIKMIQAAKAHEAGSVIGLILTITATIVALIRTIKSIQKAKAENVIKKNKEAADAIKESTDSIREQTKSLEENRDAWKEAVAQQQKCIEEYQTVKENVDSIIDSIKKLNETLGGDFDITGLEKAASLALATGDFDDFNKEVQKAREESFEELVNRTAMMNKGNIQKYNLEVRDSKEVRNSQQLIQRYEKLQEKRAELYADYDKNEKRIKKIDEDIETMQEAYDAVIEGQSEVNRTFLEQQADLLNGLDLDSLGQEDLQAILTDYYLKVQSFGKQIGQTNKQIEESFRRLIQMFPTLNRQLAITDKITQLSLQSQDYRTVVKNNGGIDSVQMQETIGGLKKQKTDLASLGYEQDNGSWVDAYGNEITNEETATNDALKSMYGETLKAFYGENNNFEGYSKAAVKWANDQIADYLDSNTSNTYLNEMVYGELLDPETNGVVTSFGENGYATPKVLALYTEYGTQAMENRKQAQEAAQNDFTDYFETLTETDQDLLLRVNLNFVDSIDDLQAMLDNYKDLTIRTKVDLDTKEILKEKVIADNAVQSSLENAIKEYQEKGEVSTDTAYELIDQGLSKYLVREGEAFKLTTIASNEYNRSLEEETAAVAKLLDGVTNIKFPMAEFIEQMLVYSEGDSDNKKINELVKNITDLAASFQAGTIESEKFFEEISEYIQEIGAQASQAVSDSEEDLAKLQSMLLTVERTIVNMLNTAKAGVESGDLNASEYWGVLQQGSDTANEARKQQINIIIEQRKNLAKEIESLGGHLGHGRDGYEYKYIGNDEEALEKVTKLNREYVSLGKTQEQLGDIDFEKSKFFESWSEFAKSIEENYTTFEKYFNNEFNLKVDTSQLNAAANDVEMFRETVRKSAEAVGYDINSELGQYLSEMMDYELKTTADWMNAIDSLSGEGFSGALQAATRDAETASNEVTQSINSALQTINEEAQNITYTLEITPNEDTALKLEPSDGGYTLAGSLSATIGLTEGEKNKAAIEAIAKAGGQIAVSGPKMTVLATYAGDKQSANPYDFNTEDDDKKSDKEYFERYENIERKIDNLTNAMDRYKDVADDAFGNMKLVALKKYEQELQKIVSANRRMYEEAQDYAAVDKYNLRQSLVEAGIAVEAEYDDQGRMINMEEIRKAFDERAKGADEKTLEALDEANENLDKYLETEDKIVESWNSILDNIRDLMQAKLDQIKEQVDRVTGIADEDIKLSKTLRDLFGETGLRRAGANGVNFAYSQLQKDFNSQIAKAEAYTSGLEEITKILNNVDSTKVDQSWFEKEFGKEEWAAYQQTGAIPANFEETIREYRSNLADLAVDMKQTLADMMQNLQDTLQVFLNEFDLIKQEMSGNMEELTRLEPFIEATSYENTRAGIEDRLKISQAREDQADREVEMATRRRDLLGQQRDQYQNVINQITNNGKKDIEDLTDAECVAYDVAISNYKNAADEFYQAEQEVTTALNARLEQAQKTMETMKELAKEVFYDQVGIYNMDALQTMYDNQDKLDNFFLDAYEKEYSISKLENGIQEQLKGIDNPERLQEWAKFQDKLNKLREEGVELTQTDYEILEAEFELEKLKDQYEKAKDSNNSMRLVRDASGNYSYVYSSNAKEVEKLEQQIKDAEANIYKLRKNANKETQSAWLDLQKYYESIMANYDDELYQTDEKYKQYIDSITSYYERMNGIYAEKINGYTKDLGWTFEDTTINKVLPAFGNMDDAAKAFRDAFCGEGGYKDALIQAQKDCIEKVKELAEQFGVVFGENGTLATDVDDAVTAVNDANDALILKLTGKDGVVQKAQGAISSIGQELKKFVTGDFNSNMTTILEKIQEVTTALDELENRNNAAAQKAETEGIKTTPAISDEKPSSGNESGQSGNNSAGTGSTSSNGKEPWRDEYEATKGKGKESTIRILQQALFGRDLLEYEDIDGSWGPKSQEAALQAFGTRSFEGAYEAWQNEIKEKASIEEQPQQTENSMASQTPRERTFEPKTDGPWLPFTILGLGTKGFIRSNAAAEEVNGFVKVGNYWYEGAKVGNTLQTYSQQALMPYVETTYAPYAKKIEQTSTGGLISTPQIRSLAEKGPELVLNSVDTENILNAVKAIRSTVAMQQGNIRFSNLQQQGSAILAALHRKASPDTVKQDVKIEASFPNACTSKEIEDAFNDLINESFEYSIERR